MPERLKFEFGFPYFSQRRAQSAAEAIGRSFAYRFADTDQSWAVAEGYFPEYAGKIHEVREVIKRRRNLLNSSNSDVGMAGMSHAARILREVHDITKFPYAFETAVLVNRLFPKNLPQGIGKVRTAAVLRETEEMILETNGIVRQDGKLTDFIILVLNDKVRLSPVPTPPPAPQLNLGLV